MKKTLIILMIAICFAFIKNANAETFSEIPYGPVCVTPQHDLKYGSRDYYIFGNVARLQLFLYKNGLMDYPPTGYFGPITQEGIKKYQTENDLRVSGVFDYYTRKAIAEETCNPDEINLGLDVQSMYPVIYFGGQPYYSSQSTYQQPMPQPIPQPYPQPTPQPIPQPYPTPGPYTQNEGTVPPSQPPIPNGTGGWACSINGQTYGTESAYVAGCR